MRVLRFSASVLALSSLACAIGKEGEPDGHEQDPACAMYLDCLTAIDPDAVGLALETYGESGSCWETADAAEACAAACEEAVSSAHQAVPDEPACDDGSELSSETLLGPRADWSFYLEDLDPDCEFDIGVVDVAGTLEGSDTAAFSFAAEATASSLTYDERIDLEGEWGCTLDVEAFTCVAVVLEEVEASGSVYTHRMELSGTFDGTYTTMELVTDTEWLRDGEAFCTSRSTLSGERR